MSMTSAALFLAPAGAPVLQAEEELRQLPMEPWAYGAIALGVILALLGIVWMFRNTAQLVLDGRPPHRGDAHHGNADIRGGGRTGH